MIPRRLAADLRRRRRRRRRRRPRRLQVVLRVVRAQLVHAERHRRLQPRPAALQDVVRAHRLPLQITANQRRLTAVPRVSRIGRRRRRPLRVVGDVVRLLRDRRQPEFLHPGDRAGLLGTSSRQIVEAALLAPGVAVASHLDARRNFFSPMKDRSKVEELD